MTGNKITPPMEYPEFKLLFLLNEGIDQGSFDTDVVDEEMMVPDEEPSTLLRLPLWLPLAFSLRMNRCSCSQPGQLELTHFLE